MVIDYGRDYDMQDAVDGLQSAVRMAKLVQIEIATAKHTDDRESWSHVLKLTQQNIRRWKSLVLALRAPEPSGGSAVLKRRRR